jgi:hypothetical protein
MQRSQIRRSCLMSVNEEFEKALINADVGAMMR